MNKDHAATTTTVISEADQRRIHAAMSRMPYAATERVPKPWVAMGDAVDADAVVAFLDGLADVLAEVAEHNDAHRRRLFSLEADVAAFRRLIGTATAEVTSFWPETSFVNVGVRGDASELDGLPSRGEVGETRAIKYVDAVAQVMARRMELDERIVVMGEDVHRLNGGTNGATKGLFKSYGERVLGTPISENAFTGLAGGLALDGRFRPVVEFMYPDFMWVAADQVFNQIGKARHMFGRDNPVPLVLRTKVAMGSGYGSQHLMDPAGIFATNPGWRIVAASNASDYVGLMNAALALEDPVLVIEHVDLYGQADEVPAGDLDYVIAPGSAALVRTGSEVTVISYLSMVAHAQEAIQQTGIDADLIDLRWLDRASIDWDTIGKSIEKTNAVLIAEQGAQGTSYGAWLADEIQRRYFDWLDQPVARVTGQEASPSISKVLERAAIARTEEVVAGLEAVRTGFGA